MQPHGYDDECLAALMAANYEAFRRRRTLLLLNLEHQVRVEELPWVRAVEPHRRRDDGTGAAVRAIDDTRDKHEPGTARTSPTFDRLCFSRAGTDRDGFSVAANGTVIEQAQILTTHNLAALVEPSGIGHAMSLEFPRLAERCFAQALLLTGRLHDNPRPLRTVNDLAYAWRQMVFFLALSTPSAQRELVATFRSRLAEEQSHVQRIAPALDGLETILGGGAFDPAGRASTGRRLLGWTVGDHWLLAAAP